MKIMNKRKTVLLLTAVALLLTVAVGGTIAYLTTSTGTVENVFESASVPIEITEDFDGTEKKNVCVKNNGNVDAYIRATYVINLVGNDGVKPISESDCSIQLNTSDWTESGGYYYYTKDGGKVAPGASTNALIVSCKLKDGVVLPTGYTLQVEVLAQSIQADGMNANSAQDAFAKAGN